MFKTTIKLFLLIFIFSTLLNLNSFAMENESEYEKIEPLKKKIKEKFLDGKWEDSRTENTQGILSTDFKQLRNLDIFHTTHPDVKKIESHLESAKQFLSIPIKYRPYSIPGVRQTNRFFVQLQSQQNRETPPAQIQLAVGGRPYDESRDPMLNYVQDEEYSYDEDNPNHND